jgi:predicted PurR-regulated permease PerM
MAIDEQQVHAGPPMVAKPHLRQSGGFWARNLIGIGAILALCYYGELVLVTMLVSVLVAFILAPVVEWLMLIPLPRGVAALIAVLVLLTLGVGTVYFSYNQAASFLNDLPKYTQTIREGISRVSSQAETLEALNPGTDDKNVMKVQPTSTFSERVTRGFGSVSQIVLAVSFVPFLVYFMLTWQQHVRSATVMLFALENRHTAYVTLGLIGAMIRTFMVGNLLIGLFIGAVSTLIFGALQLPFFYFAGILSGFLSLVPYMGVLLALAPPVFVGLGHIDSGDLFFIVLTVFGLHLIALNVLYPKFLGNRLQLNPLAVTMSLLVWAWLWGAVGLVLAIPITAATKIIFDHVESLQPFGAWLGE